MECRIQVVDAPGARAVNVAGRLGCVHIPDLLMACGGLSRTLRVDLTEMVSADAIAIEALRRIRDRGALVAGAPTYIQLILDSPPRR